MKILTLLCLTLFSLNGFAARNLTFSFNLHCAFEDWQFRIDAIAKYLGQSQPDFISFQEVCVDEKTDMIAGILRALRKHGYQVAASDAQFSHMAWDRYREYIMVASKHKAEAKDKGLLPVSPLQRAYVALKVQGVWNVNTHLEYGDQYARFRAEQVSFLIQRFKGTPHLIMGDFNADPRSPEQSAFVRTGYFGVFPGPSRPAHKPEVAIDGFWISPELRSSYQVQGTRLLFDRKIGERYASDHLAVELMGFRSGRANSF